MATLLLVILTIVVLLTLATLAAVFALAWLLAEADRDFSDEKDWML